MTTTDTGTTVATTGTVDLVLLHPDATHARFIHHADDRASETVLIVPRADWEELGCPVQIRVTTEVQCRRCGCTDSEACDGGCSWFEVGLCSRCAA